MMDVVIKIGGKSKKKNKIYRIYLKTNPATEVLLKKIVIHSGFVWKYFFDINHYRINDEIFNNTNQCINMNYLLDLLNSFSLLLESLLQKESAPKSLYEKYFIYFYRNLQRNLEKYLGSKDCYNVKFNNTLRQYFKLCNILKKYVDSSIEKKLSKPMDSNEMCNWLTLLKRSDKYFFLNESPCIALQQKLRDLFIFHNKKSKEQQYSSILHQLNHNNSFRIVFGRSRTRNNFCLKNNGIKLPKVGWIDFYKNYKIDGNYKTVTVVCCENVWHICLQVEID